MEYQIRRAQPADLEGAVATEELAMKGGGYLRDVAELFFLDRRGSFLVAQAGEEIVGVAKYTLLYDGSAWLETLRVRPDWQRRGIGRAFYEAFVARSHELGVDTMRMYTGVKNVASASLARLFGLEKEQVYREASLNLEGKAFGEPVTGFVQVDPQRAIQLLEPAKEAWKGFMILNRTFYAMPPALYAGLAQEGKVYEDRETGSKMVLGNRFLGRRSLQIGYLGGDLQKCLDFARQEAMKAGVPRVIVMFPPEDEKLQGLLEQNGYEVMASDLMVMGGKLA